jgi:hypothetical protein
MSAALSILCIIVMVLTVAVLGFTIGLCVLAIREDGRRAQERRWVEGWRTLNKRRL